MSFSEFLKFLSITMLFLIAALICLHSFTAFKDFIDLSIVGISFFLLLNFLVFLAGNKAVRSKNKYSYIHLIILNFLIKLVFSVLILLVYQKITKPDTNMYIVPFILIYLGFTIFETIYMTRQSKTNMEVK